MGAGLSKKQSGRAKRLETVGLSFRALAEAHGHVGSKVLRLPVNIEWVSAEKALADAFGRQVYFSWQDEDETVVVDTPEEWEDLVAELSEDFVEENEYNGIMEVQLVEADQADKTVSGHRRAADGGATACELGVAGSSTASQVEPEVVAADRDTAAAGEGAEREDKSVSASEDRPKLDVMGVGVEAFPLGPVRNPVEEARRRMESAQNVGDAP